MTISALVMGTLQARPEVRTGANGKPYTLARIRAADDAGASLVVSCIAFSNTAQRVLAALDVGSALAVSGPLKLSVWQPPDGGEPRVNASMTIDEVLTAGQLKKRRQAIADARGEGPEGRE